MGSNFDYVVVVPTLNARKDWARFEEALRASVPSEKVLVVDSASTDGTPELARNAGFRLLEIERNAFNHGGTRQLAAEQVPGVEVIVYMTQDAVLAHRDSITTLLDSFHDSKIAAAFGRQLPRPGAGPIEAHARLFNYPPQSSLRSLQTRGRLGLKTAFFSNSFGAYRRSALLSVGGFPADVILGEDTVTVARLLLDGWDIAYVAEAEAYHSHQYTSLQEFKRCFDIGVLHSREDWLLQEFGQASGEGRRFVLSELKHLWPRHAIQVPAAAFRTGLKLLGYKAGRMESAMSSKLKCHLSMHRFFWTEAEESAS